MTVPTRKDLVVAGSDPHGRRLLRLALKMYRQGYPVAGLYLVRLALRRTT